MMKISDNGLNMIASFEGLSLTAYRCPAGFLTIGYGHLIKKGDGFTKNSKITKFQALQLFRKDLEIFETCINLFVKVKLTQNQFDSLVSLAFNIGEWAFRRSTLLRLLNTSFYYDASNEFMKWVFIGTNISEGLINRRKIEKALFLRKDI